MMWLDMTRGNRLPGSLTCPPRGRAPAESWWLAACVAVAAFVWLSPPAMGQLLAPTQEPRPTFQPLLSDQEPTPGRFVVPEPGVVQSTSADSQISYEQPEADQSAEGSRPGDGGVMGRCPDCNAVYDHPLLGGHRRGANSRLGCPAPLRQLLGRWRPFGRPLQGESWLYRPFSAGWFMGMVQGGPLIDDWVGQKQGFFGGYRLGWDHNHYWGGEMRFAFGSVELFDSQRAKDAQQAADTEAGLAPDHPWRQRFDARRDADLFQWDLSLLYYPWGDTQWRPYLMAGLGSARVGFTDRLSRRFDKVVFAMPLAVGMKYRCNDWLALRFQCADNIAFGGGSGFNTLHNFSVTGGVEVRFGGSRKAYWPWNPGRHYW